jgi:hypothetical protein
VFARFGRLDLREQAEGPNSLRSDAPLVEVTEARNYILAERDGTVATQRTAPVGYAHLLC